MLRLLKQIVLGLAVVSSIDFAFGAEPPEPASGDRTETAATSIKGIVVDSNQQPVAGIPVRLYPVSKQQEELSRFNSSRGVPLMWVSLETTPKNVTTDARGEFQFDVSSRKEKYYGCVVAENPENHYAACRSLVLHDNAPPLRLVLRAQQEVKLTVVDAKNNPVAGATVAVNSQVPYPWLKTTTDAAGKAQLRIPATVSSTHLFAYKSHIGFDGTQIQRLEVVGAIDDQDQLAAQEVQLQLDGAFPVKFIARNSAGDPLSGISIFPNRVYRPKHSDSIDFARDNVQVVTDADGVATIDWLPRDFGDRITFVTVTPERYTPPEELFVENANPNAQIEIILKRKAKLSGQVTLPDGKPVANIAVSAVGNGRRLRANYANTTTTADGAYEISVPADRSYLICVTDKNWAARACTAANVKEDSEVTDLDFDLIRGTVIRGVVTGGPKKLPLADQMVTLRMTLLPLPAKIRAGGPDVPLTYTETTRTDEKGNYQFRVGPGNYSFSLPGLSVMPNFVVQDEPEIVRDIEVPRNDVFKLSGKVVGPDGEPVADAEIAGIYNRNRLNKSHYFDGKAPTAADGSFSLEREALPLTLKATSKDGKLAGIVRLGPDQESVVIKLSELAEARGKLVDSKGVPVTVGKIDFSVRVHTEEGPNAAFMYLFSVQTRPDAEGRFTVSGLLPGEEWSVSYKPEADRGMWPLKQFTPKDTSPIDLGELRAPSEKRR